MVRNLSARRSARNAVWQRRGPRHVGMHAPATKRRSVFCRESRLMVLRGQRAFGLHGGNVVRFVLATTAIELGDYGNSIIGSFFAGRRYQPPVNCPAQFVTPIGVSRRDERTRGGIGSGKRRARIEDRGIEHGIDRYHDGIIEGWHGDGNVARTGITYAFRKGAGPTGRVLPARRLPRRRAGRRNPNGSAQPITSRSGSRRIGRAN